MTFKELNIIEPILKALKEKGYTEPTPIQAKAIPVILNKRDILGVAQTGTGKTAAFAIPIIQILNENEHDNNAKPKIRTLIVTPTRELAIQIDDNIKEYSKHTKIKHTVIYGGVKQGAQVTKLNRGVHILTATPGRLLDLIDQNIVSLADISLFVLDEADRMLDMGFINDIRRLIKIIPKNRQSLFFSATMPDNIVELSSTILNKPVKVEVTPVSSTAEKITQYVYYTNRDSKSDLLEKLLREKNIDQALIFTRTKHGADRVAKRLNKQNIKSSSIHGDKAQNQRQNALAKFKDGDLRVLVATDIAARGIDIDKLSYVINYEVPNMPETYVHRIGRTGRAGEDGVAISLCEPEENAFIKDIQKLIGNQIETATDTEYPQTEKPMTDAEKKEWEKEKQRRKQEFFANRKNGKGNQGRGQGQKKEKREDKPNNKQKPNNRRSADSQDASKQQSKKVHPKKTSNNEQNNTNQEAKPAHNPNKKRHSNKKKSDLGDKMQGSRYKGMSDNLKSKFMWPLE